MDTGWAYTQNSQRMGTNYVSQVLTGETHKATYFLPLSCCIFCLCVIAHILHSWGNQPCLQMWKHVAC